MSSRSGPIEAALEIPKKPGPGYRLDRYELICSVARGGMADVWIARIEGRSGFEKHFAIKTILPDLAWDIAFHEMFLDEARIAAGIVHPNVAQILDLGDHEGVPYIVMEWVEGDSLQQLDRLAQKSGEKIPIGVVLRTMADVCGGLQAAHELRDAEGSLLGVVHRDVSPHNVLISVATGTAKLIDFGIAKARDRIGGDTSAGLMKGKIQFMAPEQPFGNALDRRTDVWAVGATIHKLLLGTTPYQDETESVTLKRIVNGGAPNPIPATIPAPVADVLRRALAVSPDDRFPSAAALQSAIETAMVEAKIETSCATVAEYANRHLAERMAAQRKLVAAVSRGSADRSAARAIDPLLVRKAFGDDSSPLRIAPPVPSIAPQTDPSVSTAVGTTAQSIPPEVPNDGKGRSRLRGTPLLLLLVGAVAVVVATIVFWPPKHSSPSAATNGAPTPTVTATSTTTQLATTLATQPTSPTATTTASIALTGTPMLLPIASQTGTISGATKVPTHAPPHVAKSVEVPSVAPPTTQPTTLPPQPTAKPTGNPVDLGY